MPLQFNRKLFSPPNPTPRIHREPLLEPSEATLEALADPGSPKQPLQFWLNSLCESVPNQLRQGDGPAELHFEVFIPHY